jgi:hypothetical protein
MSYPRERLCFYSECRKPFTAHEVRDIYCCDDCKVARETQEREKKAAMPQRQPRKVKDAMPTPDTENVEEETEAQIRQRITEAGCDPDDPDSHEWQKQDDPHPYYIMTTWYKCSRCGTEDSDEDANR